MIEVVIILWILSGLAGWGIIVESYGFKASDLIMIPGAIILGPFALLFSFLGTKK